MHNFEARETVPQKGYETIILFNQNAVPGFLQREVR
jgi:hypothetical protein